jgi:hypothetical protein
MKLARSSTLPSRNLLLALALAAGIAIGAAILPSMVWAGGLAAILGLAGVVLFRGDRWRTGALLFSAVAIAVVFLDALAGWLAPAPKGQGIVSAPEFHSWVRQDPLLGFRLRPNNIVHAKATLGEKLVYRADYTIGADGWRATPAAPTGADTYLFMGDSCVFGQGLDDDQTLAAQFAKMNDFKVRTATLAVPGYGPTHLVRAFEVGLLDGYLGQPVKAVVTWIKPQDISRATGDESWLGSSPRYVLEDGKLRYTGSFTGHRWRNPVDGLLHFAGEHFAFIKAIGMRQRQERQADVFVALIERLQALAREKFGAPLIVVYNWPDKPGPPESGTDFDRQALIAILDRVRRLETPLVSVVGLLDGIEVSRWTIPHDGHPSALVDHLIAAELKRRLNVAATAP